MKAIFNSRPWIILEPIILLVVFGLLAMMLYPFAGYSDAVVEDAVFGAAGDPDWGLAATMESRALVIKWGLLLAAAFVLARMRGYRLLQPLPRDRARLSLGELALFGIAFSIPLNLLAMVPRWYHYTVAPLGEVPPIWDIIYTSPFTPDFLMFMAVSSVVLVPIVEELFFRGYFLGALAQRFSPFAVVLISALVFALVHLQYVSTDLFALYNLSMVFLFTVFTVISVYVTRSLLPAIAAHAYTNMPVPLEFVPYQTSLLIVSIVLLFWLVPKLGRSG